LGIECPSTSLLVQIIFIATRGDNMTAVDLPTLSSPPFSPSRKLRRGRKSAVTSSLCCSVAVLGDVDLVVGLTRRPAGSGGK
jgi:hypothetical protein